MESKGAQGVRGEVQGGKGNVVKSKEGEIQHVK
jgi:hypothetical protein